MHASCDSNIKTVSYTHLGWTCGAFAGEVLMNFLPVALQNAMGIALYGMFLAIIVPPATKLSLIHI